ncbi:MAG TPA: MoaD/ThiS family protein [Gammaproteobacteria bacterium]|nr:MoaD/ThiS family protein [Gammaproteobacteria bacterium]
MSRIIVLIPPPLRPFAGGAAELAVEATTVGEALKRVGEERAALLARIMTPEGELRPYVNVFVGERNARHLDGLRTPLAEGDVVAIIPAVAGG